MRALAALAVLCGHAIAWLTPLPGHPATYAPVSRLTQAGLAAFFVLSGFVLQYNHGAGQGRKPLRPGRFALSRLARIYPVYGLLLLVALVQILLQEPWVVTRYPGNALSMATLTQSWFFIPEAPAIFPLAWAISTEVFFYLLFPGLTWLLARAGGRRGALCAGLAALGAAVALDVWIAARWPWIFAWIAARNPGYAKAQEALAGMFFPWLTYTCPYVRVFDFCIGMAAARYHVLGGRVPRALAPAAGCALAVVLAIPRPEGWFFLSVLDNNVLYAPFLAALCLGLAAHPPAWASWRAIVGIGAASLSIYLVQPWALDGWRPLAKALPSLWPLALAAGLAATLAAGILLTRFVEAPMARRIGMIGRRGKEASGGRGG